MNRMNWTALALALSCLQPALAKDKPSQLPLLVIGASYSEGKTPFNNGIAPLGGVSVGLGSYLSLGQALTRNDDLPGFVINEAQAGATTFARPFCAPGAATCGPAGWDGYDVQLQKALARVAVPPSFSQVNAKYVVITMSNDCLHADAFGIPQSQSQPCTPAQMNATVDRLVALGNVALSRGVVPVYDVHPRYERLDLNLFRSLFGLAWVISEADYDNLRQLSRSRLRAELPAAVVLDIWKDFEHIGDGLHPAPASARKAARLIAAELARRDGQH
ncbi:MAG TPA: hypothetical protein VGP22_15430 [Albitalea sp.]|jgi:hypothetical protein|nr:hypothetical protein [Albitalea sp.]